MALSRRLSVILFCITFGPAYSFFSGPTESPSPSGESPADPTPEPSPTPSSSDDSNHHQDDDGEHQQEEGAGQHRNKTEELQKLRQEREKLRKERDHQMAHIEDDEQREADRFAEELRWAGSNVGDQKGVNATHNDTLRRLEKSRRQIEHRYTKGLARLEEHRNASELLASSPLMLSGEVGHDDSKLALQHLDMANQRQMKHLQAEESREEKRFVEETAWAGDDAQAQKRLAVTHNETLHRLMKARVEEEHRYKEAKASLEAGEATSEASIQSVRFQSLHAGAIFIASASFGTFAAVALRGRRTLHMQPLLG